MMVNLKFYLIIEKSLFLRENSVFNQDNLSYVYLVKIKIKFLKKKLKLVLKDGLVEILMD